MGKTKERKKMAAVDTKVYFVTVTHYHRASRPGGEPGVSVQERRLSQSNVAQHILFSRTGELLHLMELRSACVGSVKASCLDAALFRVNYAVMVITSSVDSKGCIRTYDGPQSPDAALELPPYQEGLVRAQQLVYEWIPRYEIDAMRA